LLKRSHLRVVGQKHKNLIGQEENLIYSRSDPFFEQNLELATEGLEPYFLNHLKTKISSDNALAISKYVLSMKTEASISSNYRRNILSSLKLLSEFLDNKPFIDMTREDIVSYLDSLRKAEHEDVLHKWVGTYNIRLAFFTGFFKWLYHNEIEASRRLKPQLLANVPMLKRKEQSIYKPTDLWTQEDDLHVQSAIVILRNI
jgi:hypothetical protein